MPRLFYLIFWSHALLFDISMERPRSNGIYIILFKFYYEVNSSVPFRQSIMSSPEELCDFLVFKVKAVESSFPAKYHSACDIINRVLHGYGVNSSVPPNYNYNSMSVLIVTIYFNFFNISSTLLHGIMSMLLSIETVYRSNQLKEDISIPLLHYHIFLHSYLCQYLSVYRYSYLHICLLIWQVYISLILCSVSIPGLYYHGQLKEDSSIPPLHYHMFLHFYLYQYLSISQYYYVLICFMICQVHISPFLCSVFIPGSYYYGQ